MKMFKLERFCDHEEMGVFGRLFLDGVFLAYTVEQPWRNNEKNRSCVPAGDYKLVPYDSPKHGQTFALHNPALNVYSHLGLASGANDRFACLFVHSANETTELQGCVAAGRGLGMVDSDHDGTAHWSLVSSVQAVKKVLALADHAKTEAGQIGVSIYWKQHEVYPHK